MKLAIAFRRFGPYHLARLNAIAAVCDIVAIEYSRVDAVYAWDLEDDETDFSRIVIAEDSDQLKSHRHLMLRRISSVLDTIKPDVVAIPGWSSCEALASLNWCIRRGVPAVLLSDSTRSDYRRYAWGEWLKGRIVRLYSAGLVAGTAHGAYVQELGIKAEQVFSGFDVVDNAYFISSTDSVRSSCSRFAAVTGLIKPFFLTVSRFIPEKNLQSLIEAFSRYRVGTGADGWDLVLVGDGVERQILVDLCEKYKISTFVHFVGFRQYSELSTYYGLASVFVLPSAKDTWGLAVNEAMAAGLPVLVSKRCGCAVDLVDEGRNGYTFDPYNIDALVNLMLKVSMGSCDLAAMGRVSREIIAKWTLQTFAENLVKACKAALTSRLPKATLFDKVLLWLLIMR